jgi:hypothetical protein
MTLIEKARREADQMATGPAHAEDRIGRIDALTEALDLADELAAALEMLWSDARECADWSDGYRARIEAVIAKAIAHGR